MINAKHIGDLLLIALECRNSKSKKKIEVKPKIVCREFAKAYLDSVFREAVNVPASVDFGELGSVRVVEHLSRKGYEWDQKYDAKDWTVIWEHDFKHAKIAVDQRLSRVAAIKAAKGMQYGR